MHSIARIAGISFVFITAWIAWVVLGSITSHRTSIQSESLADDVNSLWGTAQRQDAPSFTHVWQRPRVAERTENDKNGNPRIIRENVIEDVATGVSPASSEITADIHLDQRLRGLMWYSLYDIAFSGHWTYEHAETTSGKINLGFQFPDASAIYDDFHFIVNGTEMAARLHPQDGGLVTEIAVKPGDHIDLVIAYRSRGRDSWSYQPVVKGVDGLREFRMTLDTDFKDIDFPVPSMSPSERHASQKGQQMQWVFKHVYTGQVMGVQMPKHIQPGELASDLSYSAPVSLLFFFVILFVMSVLRNLDIHPVNYFFIACAFFSFQLLFAYLIDRLPMWASFGIASVTSIALVVSYLRLVVSARFAFVEAAAAQLVYQVGFAAAHFLEGYTGLTVTVLATLTLGLLMQLTGRIKWSATLSGLTPSAGSTVRS
jgi:inner membrane protein involved in colicin E2 resistance